MHTPGFSAYLHPAIAAGLFLVSAAVYGLSRRGWVAPVVILFVLAFHPAWTIEPGQERDFSKRQTGTAATGLAASAVLTQVIWISWVCLCRPPSGSQLDDYGDTISLRTPPDRC
jgi:hypothetical protein